MGHSRFLNGPTVERHIFVEDVLGFGRRKQNVFTNLYVPVSGSLVRWRISGGRRRVSTIREEDPGFDNVVRTIEDDNDPVLLECDLTSGREVRDGS